MYSPGLGDGEQHVHHAHDPVVDPAAVIAGRSPQHPPNDQGDVHGDEADLQGDAGAEDQAAQNVVRIWTIRR